jgi:cytoskeletal protein CcmA (bactofilin family)
MHLEAIPGKQIESEITLIGQGSVLKGEIIFDRLTRIHGRIEGNVLGLKNSLIVIGEPGSVHGEIHGDEVIIDGFVHGDVYATTKLTISESGKLIGNATAPKLEVKFGAHFEGRAITSHAPGTNAPSAERREQTPSKA